MTRAEMIATGYIGPKPGDVIRAVDQMEADGPRCRCAWDGAPDATISQIVAPDCPVHGEDSDAPEPCTVMCRTCGIEVYLVDGEISPHCAIGIIRCPAEFGWIRRAQ